MGDRAEAESLIRRAIAVQSGVAVYHSNLGIVLAAGGRLQEAVEVYQEAAGYSPNSPETHNNLGVAHYAMEHHEPAAACFRKAFLMNLDYVDARNNLSRSMGFEPDSAHAYRWLAELLQAEGRTDKAIEFYRLAIAIDPGSAASHNNLGNALTVSGQTPEAIQCYRTALSINPDFLPAVNNLANLFSDSGDFAAAVPLYLKAIEAQPPSPDLLSNLGNALRESGQRAAAMQLYAQALSLSPDHVKTHNNIGSALCEQGRWDNATESFQRALVIDPGFAEAINNLGTALEEMGQRDQAMDCYKRAMVLAPAALSPPWNIALLQLLRGDYENGWLGYEHRWKQKKQCRSFRNFPQPLLSLHTELEGKSVLLHAEQGFGDAIQFCRYAQQLANLGAKVIMECPPELVRLFQSLRGVARVIPRGAELPEFEIQCPLMSLPMVFGTRLGTVPAAIPYLQPDAADEAHWSQRMVSQSSGRRVGLVWAGQSTHQRDQHRSLTLSAFDGLAEVQGINWYNLRVGDRAGGLNCATGRMHLIDWTADLHDFADTAGLLSQLDLVITVDTAVAHLAGAMGKPVWILLSFQPDWRWLLDRQDSPWYPSARLFRQIEPGNWDQPLNQLFAALTRWVQHGGAT